MRGRYRVAFHGYSQAGNRGANEDAWVAQVHPRSAHMVLCAVSDGQGGQFGGGAASRLACDDLGVRAGRHPTLALHWPASWARLLRSTDVRVRADHEAGFCTMVALSVTRRRVSGAACGDSLAVLAVGDDAACTLTQHQRKNPPLGSGAARFTPFRASVHPRKPWTLLLMTDGVWKYTGKDAVTEAAICNDTPQRIVEMLRRAAAINGPAGGRTMRDDFTVVVVQNRYEDDLTNG